MGAVSIRTWILKGTNGTVYGNSVTIAGKTLTFSNALTSTTILTNTSPAGSVTNLYAQLGSFPIGGVTGTMTNTNTIVFRGDALVVSQSGNWCSLTSSTNLGTNLWDYTLPIDNIPSLATRTNNASNLVYSTKYSPPLPGGKFGSNWPAMDDFVATGSSYSGGTQQIVAPKFFQSFGASNQHGIFGGRVVGPSIEDGSISNAQVLSLRLAHNDSTWAINFMADIEGTTNAQIKSDANGWAGLYEAFGGQPFDATPAPDEAEAAIMNWWSIKRMVPMYKPVTSVGSNWWTIDNFYWGDRNVFASGYIATNTLNQTATNLDVLQRSSEFAGTNKWSGDIAYPVYALISLGNSNNFAIPIGTNVNVAGSGPTNAYTICGICCGRDGRDLWYWNNTAYPVTFSQNTVDPTPENRLVCNVAGDVTFGAREIIHLIWMPSDSRWHFSVATATATNVPTTGTSQTNFSTWNSSVANVSLTVNGIDGTGTDLQCWKTNNVTAAAMGSNGVLRVAGLTNAGPLNQAGAVVNYGAVANRSTSTNTGASDFAAAVTHYGAVANRSTSTNTGASDFAAAVTLYSSLNVSGLTTAVGEQALWIQASNVTVTASNATTPSLILKDAPGTVPSTNRTEWKDSAGYVRAGVDQNGFLFTSVSNSAVQYPACYRVFTQTADSAVTNITTTETSWMGTGVGSLVLTQGFWAVGRSVVVEMRGTYWTPASPGNSLIRFKLGSTVIATNVPMSLGSGFANNPFYVRMELTCRTNSATGYIEANGEFTGPSTSEGTGLSTRSFVSTLPVLDTTAAMLLDLTSTNGASTVSFKVRQVRVNLNP